MIVNGPVLRGWMVGVALAGAFAALSPGRAWAAETKPSPSQEAAFELVASVKPKIATIGDEIKLTIEVLHAPGIRILDLPKKLELAPFEVKRTERLSSKESGGAVAEGFRLTLTLFELGEKSIPPVPVSFVAGSGPAKTVYTDALPVFVQSVGGAGAPPGTPLKPIRGPKDLPGEKLWRWIWRVVGIVAVVLAVALAACLISRWLGGRKKILTPYERSKQTLERLRSAPWTDKIEARIHPFEIKEALRSYWISLGIGAPEMTTREWRGCLEADPSTRADADEVIRLFEAADRAQFALEIPDEGKFRSGVEEALRILESVRQKRAANDARKPKRRSASSRVPASEARA